MTQIWPEQRRQLNVGVLKTFAFYIYQKNPCLKFSEGDFCPFLLSRFSKAIRATFFKSKKKIILKKTHWNILIITVCLCSAAVCQKNSHTSPPLRGSELLTGNSSCLIIQTMTSRSFLHPLNDEEGDKNNNTLKIFLIMSILKVRKKQILIKYKPFLWFFRFQLMPLKGFKKKPFKRQKRIIRPSVTV